jgi:hypothetical protein
MSNIRPSAASFFQTPGLRPGCYDDPRFLVLERANPAVLEDYASYVLERQPQVGEEEHAKSVIERAFARIVEHVPNAQIQRRCADIGQLLTRVLEGHGVWCFGVNGSVRYVFDQASGFDERFTYTVEQPDSPGAFVGHSWLVVPPFDIVDCTATFQSWQKGEALLIPAPILAKGAHAVPPEYEISVAPETRRRQNISRSQFLASLSDFWRRFPPREVVLPRVTITYQAEGIALPDAPLSEIRNLVDDPVKLFYDL